MIEEYEPITQTFLATLFTWGLTAVGSGLVFFFNSFNRPFLDGSLGFASGVMTAASFWSLLLPALEIGDQINGNNKIQTLIPVILGFLLGAFFVFITDILLPDNYLDKRIKEEACHDLSDLSAKTSHNNESIEIDFEAHSIRQRQSTNYKDVTLKDKGFYSDSGDIYTNDKDGRQTKQQASTNFRRIILLVIAVTVHNIPEGLAVGVGFGAIGKAKTATFHNARNLALGIGIQNFPEGLAVSLPLFASGVSRTKAFWYGQLSGMVEPLAGLLGVLGVNFAQACLPYALAFAAGAMLYVVFDNLMPEAASHGNSKLSTWCCMFGFCLMMALDVGLN